MAPSCCTVKIHRSDALRFQYGKNKNGQWYWHIRARNSEIIAQGEGYKRRASVLKVFSLLASANITLVEPK